MPKNFNAESNVFANIPIKAPNWIATIDTKYQNFWKPKFHKMQLVNSNCNQWIRYEEFLTNLIFVYFLSYTNYLECKTDEAFFTCIP